MFRIAGEDRHRSTSTEHRKRVHILYLIFSLALLPGLIWGGVAWSNTTRQEVAASELPPAVPMPLAVVMPPASQLPAPDALNTPLSIASLAELPPGLHRRAAQHLEETRISEMAPGWERAVLGEDVRVLYRPDDLQNPAYFEIPVILPEIGRAHV